MKAILITGDKIKSELFRFAVIFLISFLINVYSIIAYNTKWSELYTQLLVVLALAAVIYLIYSIIRIVYYFIKKYFKKA